MFDTSKFDRWARYTFVELADPRTTHWPLLGSPVPLFTIIGLWVYFVLSWGPKLMANRKPFKLQKLMVAYNAVQVIISTYLAYPGIFDCYVFGSYSWTCEPVDRSRSPLGMKIARIVYFYYLAKLSELLDTVIFVLRKKDKQISFLHVYHHAGMPIVSWVIAKYVPGGHVVFAGLLNSIVHIVMYAYYMIAAMGPQYQKYLWWKKYITSMQLVQFVWAFIHFSQLMVFDCGFPKWIMVVAVPNSVFFYGLFRDFYNKAYNQKQERENKARKALANNCVDGVTQKENLLKEKAQ
ncbi:very long chain fatty acid elongase 7-like [Culicoides brevitarsis]|uniref:very long chain fatty acid elongase 7-like n=1 Tax=Culicoides brevitarsis TaxID=469753 RepID=UPI00307B5EDE